MSRVRKAVFPVAGFGTRFLPATKAMPRELLPVIDKPIIQYAVEEAIAAGIDTLIFVTGRNKRAIEDHFDANIELEAALAAQGNDEAREMVRNIVPSRVDCIFVRQPEQLGLGHAVLCARRAVGDEPFAVLLADDLMLQDAGTPIGDLISTYEATRKSTLSVAEVARSDVSKYGIIEPLGTISDGIWGVGRVVEKPAAADAPSRLASFGRYVLAPSVFDVLAATGRGAGGEIQLAHAIDQMARAGQVVARRFDGTRFDCGDKLGYVRAVIHAALENETTVADVADFLEGLGFARHTSLGLAAAS